MTMAAPGEEAVVFIVDDDASVSEALAGLLGAVGLRAATFSSAEEFLRHPLPDVPSCLILDVRLPGTSGLSIQDSLAEARVRMPIIFISGHGDIPMTVRAMKAGAVDFLTKPIREQDLLDAVQSALKRDRARREQDQSQAAMRRNLDSLTRREREILGLVAAGLLTKQIAAKLEIAEITVKIHRASLTRKMGARSAAQLIKIAHILGVGSEENKQDYTHV